MCVYAPTHQHTHTHESRVVQELKSFWDDFVILGLKWINLSEFRKCAVGDWGRFTEKKNWGKKKKEWNLNVSIKELSAWLTIFLKREK